MPSFKQLNYDPAALEPVAIMAIAPTFWQQDGSPAKTVADLIARQSQQGKLNYACRAQQLDHASDLEAFASRRDQARARSLPGRGPAVNDLAGGRGHDVLRPGTILPLHPGGRSESSPPRRWIGCRRSTVPTIDESGSKAQLVDLLSLMAPPRAPAEIRAN
jgi:tripartite-type tricarboxylate transporter receptor subunit TctC